MNVGCKLKFQTICFKVLIRYNDCTLSSNMSDRWGDVPTPMVLDIINQVFSVCVNHFPITIMNVTFRNDNLTFYLSNTPI